jgi:single-stranded-DNA-specific exonuclease
MSDKREEKWVIYGKRADFKGIGEKFGIDQVIARIITNRDIVGNEAIERYLHGTYADTHNPALMKDMDKGCRIMKEKIEAGKSIRIVSDYDVDGVTSNYILLEGLEHAGAKVSYEIPDRMKDGYGINERIIRDAYDDGVDTIITCDNGIAAFPAIELAKELGMTVIVTDHHEVPFEDVPVEKETVAISQNDGNGHHSAETRRIYKIVPADAVIDHKQADCGYPFKGLCGAGVAYKFIRHLYSIMGIDWPDDDWLVDILAIGTQCDVMDLVDENRIYVREGLRILNHTKNKGLAALIDVNGLKDKKLASYHLGFVIGPCINATGRLESAKRGLELLRCKDDEEAYRIANELAEINASRKTMTNNGVDQGLELVRSKYMEDTVLVVYMSELHESLAGLVAGKLREAYYKPVLVITKTEDGMLKGSGRSIEGYNMFEELTKVKALMTKFGGHEMAAGLSLEEKNLEELRRRLNENQQLTEEELTPVVRLDCAMPVSYISERLVSQLSLLEPFGKSNEKPLFAQKNLKIKRVYPLGKEGRFLKIIFEDPSGYTISGVEFNKDKFVNIIKEWFNEEECDKMLRGQGTNVYLDVVYYPDVNEYAGRKTLQIKPISYQKST